MPKRKNNFYAVIMAGGAGTRLWPLSRRAMPKQFQKFTSSKTMIQETYDRTAKVVPKDNIMVCTAEVYKNLVKKQLPKLSPGQLIIEPTARGTAAAITLAAKHIHGINPKSIVATIASDHAIKNVSEFVLSLSVALETASVHQEKLVIVG